MNPPDQKGPKFILLWTLATAWLPAALSAWSLHLAWRYRPMSTELISEMYVLGTISSATLFIIALTQWPLLVGRVPRAWLWPLAGLAIVVLERALYMAIFELSWIFEDRFLGAALYYVAYTLSAGLAVSALQTLLFRHWRLAGWSWFVVCLAAFFVATGLAELVAHVATRVFFVMNDLPLEYLINEKIGIVTFWLSFGAINGWLIHRRLNGKSVTPAWIVTVPAKIRSLRPLHSDRVS